MQSAFSWSAPRPVAIEQGALPIAAKQAEHESFNTENTEFHEAPILPPRRPHTASASSVLIPCFLAGVQPLRSKSASTNNPTTTVPATGQRGEPAP